MVVSGQWAKNKPQAAQRKSIISEPSTFLDSMFDVFPPPCETESFTWFTGGAHLLGRSLSNGLSGKPGAKLIGLLGKLLRIGFFESGQVLELPPDRRQL